MELSLARRAESLRQSEIRSMTSRSVARGGVNLSQGLCDLPTPEVVKAAACAAITDDNNTYAPLNGKRRLRELIAEKLKWFNGIQADPEKEITVASGATGAYTCALLALLDSGDRVLNFEPFYGYHVNLIRLLGFEPVFFRLEQPGWKIDLDGLEKKLAEGVRAVVINTPANPSGKVFTARSWPLWVNSAKNTEYGSSQMKSTSTSRSGAAGMSVSPPCRGCSAAP